MQKNLNVSLTNRTFALLGVCGIEFQSSVDNGLRNVKTRNCFESVLNQSSLAHWGNAMKYVQLLKMSWHWHIWTIDTSTRRCFGVFKQHRQHTIKERNRNIIRRWVGVYSVPEVSGESSPSSSNRMDHMFGHRYASRTPRVGWVMISVKYNAKIELHTELKY